MKEKKTHTRNCAKKSRGIHNIDTDHSSSVGKEAEQWHELTCSKHRLKM